MYSCNCRRTGSSTVGPTLNYLYDARMHILFQILDSANCVCGAHGTLVSLPVSFIAIAVVFVVLIVFSSFSALHSFFLFLLRL